MSNDDEIREELEYHLARRAELDQTDFTQARRKFGNPTLLQEDLRGLRIPIWCDALRQDLAYAFRTFTHTPGFTTAAVLALALGIGSVTAVFSVVDPLLFRALPYHDADRLVAVGMAAPIEPNEWLLGPDYYAWNQKQTAFDSMTATAGRRPCDITEGTPARLHCGTAEASFLGTFGVRTALGRNFTIEEDQPNVPNVALLSHALWRTRFGGDASVVGKSIELDGKPATIVGVLPSDFEFPGLQSIDFLVPIRSDVKQEIKRDAMSFFTVYARLKPGVTIDQARESLQPLFDDAMKFVPAHFRKEVKLRVSGFRERQTRDYRTASLVLLCAVFGVLLTACANVANLLLARASAREREMTIRAAIGASHGRLLRQTLTENLFLGATAGIAGITLAYLLLQLFRNLAPPQFSAASLNLRVLSFGLFLSLLAGTIAGLAPRRNRLRQVLAAAQIAISLVLLAGSGLLIRSLYRIQQIDLGVRTEHILTARVEPGRDRRSPAMQRTWALDLEKQLRQIPGVEVVALSDSLPPQDRRMSMILSRIEKQGVPLDTRGGTGGMVSTRLVSPAYFQALAVPIIKGRGFTEQDRNQPDGLVIVDENLARRLYPGGEDPLGKRIRPGGDGNEWLTITGVARNARNAGLFNPGDPEYYVLLRNNSEWDRRGLRGLFVVIRTPRDIGAIAPIIGAEISRLDPKLPVEVEALDTRVRQLSVRQRFNAMLLGLFALFALALAAIGLAGVISFLVAQRTREIGLRMALGATPASVRFLVLDQSLRSILAGAAAGLAAVLLIMRPLRSLLFQIEPNDPLILTAVTALLIVLGLGAAWLPARRAARLDPMAALRHD